MTLVKLIAIAAELLLHRLPLTLAGVLLQEELGRRLDLLMLHGRADGAVNTWPT